jgi:hypothetical protein
LGDQVVQLEPRQRDWLDLGGCLHLLRLVRVRRVERGSFRRGTWTSGIRYTGIRYTGIRYAGNTGIRLNDNTQKLELGLIQKDQNLGLRIWRSLEFLCPSTHYLTNSNPNQLQTANYNYKLLQRTNCNLFSAVQFTYRRSWKHSNSRAVVEHILQAFSSLW